jgi:hypothetical protein
MGDRNKQKNSQFRVEGEELAVFFSRSNPTKTNMILFKKINDSSIFLTKKFDRMFLLFNNKI